MPLSKAVFLLTNSNLKFEKGEVIVETTQTRTLVSPQFGGQRRKRKQGEASKRNEVKESQAKKSEVKTPRSFRRDVISRLYTKEALAGMIVDNPAYLEDLGTRDEPGVVSLFVKNTGDMVLRYRVAGAAQEFYKKKLTQSKSAKEAVFWGHKALSITLWQFRDELKEVLVFIENAFDSRCWAIHSSLLGRLKHSWESVHGPKVMHVGKTERDHTSGSHQKHIQNASKRAAENRMKALGGNPDEENKSKKSQASKKK